MKKTLADIGPTIKHIRESRGMTCEELAELAGLPVEVILRYEADPGTLTSEVALQVLEALFPPGETNSAGLEMTAEPTQEMYDEMESKTKELEAALRIDQGRFREALQGLDRALGLTRRPDRMGRILLSKAAVLSHMGRELKALEALQTCEIFLDAEEEPALWLRLRLEQLHSVCQLERYADARPWLDEAGELAERVGREWERLQVRCIRGWVAAGLGRNEEALEIFRPLRDDLMGAKREFEATAIGLDLAGLLAGRGDSEGVLALADELEPKLANKKIIPEAARTPLKLFCWAARRGNFRVEQGRKLSLELRKAGGRLTRPYEIPV
jgi:tetratricopeptide (TPR) repeat protein